MPYRNHVDPRQMRQPIGQPAEQVQAVWDQRIQQYVDPRNGVPVGGQQPMNAHAPQQQSMDPRMMQQQHMDPRMMPQQTMDPRMMPQTANTWDPRFAPQGFVQGQQASMVARSEQPKSVWGRVEDNPPTPKPTRRKRNRPAPFEPVDREPVARRPMQPAPSRGTVIDTTAPVVANINIKLEEVKMDNEEVLPPVPNTNVLGDSTYAWLKHSLGDNSGVFAKVETGYYFHVSGENAETFNGADLTRTELVTKLADLVRLGNKAAIKLDSMLTSYFMLLYNSMSKEYIGVESLVCDYDELVACSEDMISRDANALCRVMNDLLEYAGGARSEYDADESTLMLVVPETYGVVKDTTPLSGFLNSDSRTLTTDSGSIAYAGEDLMRFSYLLTDDVKLGIYDDHESGKTVVYKL